MKVESSEDYFVYMSDIWNETTQRLKHLPMVSSCALALYHMVVSGHSSYMVLRSRSASLLINKVDAALPYLTEL